ncbi:MAG: DNA (cytosine-5-)-methyltransferase, partial [Bacteroidaceae bacterium]|nr:DNA (cytosine-5-)-methyltransferase [Bacteroidaceae bacterium]
MALTFIDLFAGAGGLSEGFIQAGFTPIAHIEMDHYACDTLRTRAAFHYLKDNRGLNEYIRYLKNKKEKTNGSSLWNEVPNSVIASVIQAEISKKNITHIFHRVDNLRKERPLDVVIGGPPCQAYSVVGRARIGKKEVEKDPRNGLYKFYIKFLRYYQPKMFVFENVTGIKTAKNGKPFADIQKSAKKLGYQMDFKTQNAAWYNVLQNRK